jgi:hypothetical protein
VGAVLHLEDHDLETCAAEHQLAVSGRRGRSVARQYTPAVTLLGRRPSPRVLLMGWSGAAAKVLTEIFPTTRLIGSTADVEQDDWDALIANGDINGNIADHLYVVSFSIDLLERPHDATDFKNADSVLGFYLSVKRRQYIVPEGLNREVAELSRLLAEALEASPQWAIVEWSPRAPGIDRPRAVVPFLTTLDGHILAGKFVRKGGKAERWALPTKADPGAWILQATRHWATIAPEKFPPSSPDWKTTPGWATAAERAATKRLEDLEAAHEHALSEHARGKTQAVDELGRLRAEGDRRERALLTEQGDALVDAVEACLQSIGFDVENLDKSLKSGEAKREDLRVRRQRTGKWTAISEVRGYGEGAKTSDLTRLARFAGLFQRETGRDPDRQWYIVNQFRDRDPATRLPPLTGTPDDVEAFAEAGGLVVDTRDLLRLWLAVQRGEISPGEARDTLQKATGVFSYPPE